MHLKRSIHQAHMVTHGIISTCTRHGQRQTLTCVGTCLMSRVPVPGQ
jgi:hypothetical protein